MVDYRKIYYLIIDRRKKHPFEGYTERHHILPKSLGGSDEKHNIVNLSAREHFICHLLLTKMFEKNSPSHFKMIRAFMMMLACKSKNQKRFITSRQYHYLRERFSLIQSYSQSGMKNSQYGKPRKESVRKKISETLLKKTAAKNKLSKKEIKAEKSRAFKLKRQNDINSYREYYKIYKELGFVEFVNQTGYDKTQQNLVMRFQRLLPEFIPQNGKKRG